jgi:hypothetical protein
LFAFELPQKLRLGLTKSSTTKKTPNATSDMMAIMPLVVLSLSATAYFLLFEKFIKVLKKTHFRTNVKTVLFNFLPMRQ